MAEKIKLMANYVGCMALCGCLYLEQNKTTYPIFGLQMEKKIIQKKHNWRGA